MELVQSSYNPQTLNHHIYEPVKYFFIKYDEEIIPDSDYYIYIYINGYMISFTNKFTKILYQESFFYQLNFFQNDMVIYFDIMAKQNAKIAIFGFKKNQNTVTFKNFDKLFYQKGESRPIIEQFMRDYISYHESNLTNYIRSSCSPSFFSSIHKLYENNLDNFIVYTDDGMVATAYTYVVPWDEHGGLPTLLYGLPTYRFPGFPCVSNEDSKCIYDGHGFQYSDTDSKDNIVRRVIRNIQPEKQYI